MKGSVCRTAGAAPATDADGEAPISILEMAPPVGKTCNTWERLAAAPAVILARISAEFDAEPPASDDKQPVRSHICSGMLSTVFLSESWPQHPASPLSMLVKARASHVF